MNSKKQLTIASIVTANFFRPVLIKTLLSEQEVHNIMTEVAAEVIDSFGAMEFSGQDLINKTINESRIKLFENHNIKL